MAQKKPNEILNFRFSLVTTPYIVLSATFSSTPDIALFQVFTFYPQTFAAAP